VNVDDRVLAPGVVQDAFGGRGFTSVNVGDDADIAYIGKSSGTRQCRFPLQVRANTKGVWGPVGGADSTGI
jgi:hypothetical protein